MKQSIKYIVTIMTLCVWTSCSVEEMGDLSVPKARLFLKPMVIETVSAKSYMQVSEALVSNMNVFLYNKKGKLEQYKYFANVTEDMEVPFNVNNEYSIFVLANVGDFTANAEIQDIAGIESLVWNFSELSEMVDQNGAIPMSGRIGYRSFEDGKEVTINLTRLLAKFRIILDTLQLSNDIESFEIQEISIRNINSEIGFFSQSHAKAKEQIIPEGGSRSSDELSSLFSTGVDFYIPENAQGDLLPSNLEESTHYPPEPYDELCTFVEISVKYRNPEHYNDNLIYRYYIHDGRMDNFDVIRNSMYTCKTSFFGSGINEESWRIDVSGMKDLVTSIEVTPSSRKFTETGETYKYQAKVLPLSAENPIVVWISDDTAVATVASDGTVTAVGDGTCRITATATDGTEVSGSAEVVVDTYKFPQSVEVTPDECQIYTDETLTLTANVLPENANDKSIKWTSTNTTVATVSESGVVTGVSNGETMIIASTNANNLKDTAIIQVLDREFSIDDIPYVLYPDYNSPVTISYNAKPSCNPVFKIETVSGHDNGVLLEDCTLTAKNPGGEQGIIGSYTLIGEGNGITVNKKFDVSAGTLEISNEALTVYIGTQTTLYLSSIVPADASVAWSSSDNSVATIDSNGTITPLKTGTTIIKATSVTGAWDECEITVNLPYLAITPVLSTYEGMTLSLSEHISTGSTQNLEIESRLISGDEYVILEDMMVNGLKRSDGKRAVVEIYYVDIPDVKAKTSIIVEPAVSAVLTGSDRIVNIVGQSSDGSNWSSFVSNTKMDISHAPNTSVSWEIRDSKGVIENGISVSEDGVVSVNRTDVHGTYSIKGWDKTHRFSTSTIQIEIYKLVEYEIGISKYGLYSNGRKYYIISLASRWFVNSFSTLSGKEQNNILQQKLVNYFNTNFYYSIGSPGSPHNYLIDYSSQIAQTPLGYHKDITNGLPYERSYLRISFTDDSGIHGLTGQYYKFTEETNGFSGYYFIKQRSNELFTL